MTTAPAEKALLVPRATKTKYVTKYLGTSTTTAYRTQILTETIKYNNGVPTETSYSKSRIVNGGTRLSTVPYCYFALAGLVTLIFVLFG